jgi:hypothetical protein
MLVNEHCVVDHEVSHGADHHAPVIASAPHTLHFARCRRWSEKTSQLAVLVEVATNSPSWSGAPTCMLAALARSRLWKLTCTHLSWHDYRLLTAADTKCMTGSSSISDKVCVPASTVVGYMGGTGMYPNYDNCTYRRYSRSNVWFNCSRARPSTDQRCMTTTLTCSCGR